MNLPHPRGPLSARVIDALRTGADVDDQALGEVPETVLGNEDAQLALWTMYELHYRGFTDISTDREWDPELIRLRREIERRFEHELRVATQTSVDAVPDGPDAFPAQLLRLVDAAEGPSLAAFLHREADREQVVEFMRERSVYHLKESDPHTFVLPRIGGAAKTALAELQYDEYGAGRPDRLHATLFGDALEGCGLDRGYGAYIDEVAAETLAVNNVMSLFSMQRRLRGAALGHLAAFEMTSAVPSRKIAGGIERVGLPATVSAYFHEHVEADSVHEQVVLTDICGNVVAEDPDLREDVLFGAAAGLHLDAGAARELLDRWQAGVGLPTERAS